MMSGINSKNRSKGRYLRLQSAIRPVQSSMDESAPQSWPSIASNLTNQEQSEDSDDGKKYIFRCPLEFRSSHQNDLDDLIINLEMSKKSIRTSNFLIERKKPSNTTRKI